jgi:hypothetical protein
MRAISTKRIKPKNLGVACLSIEVEVADGTIIGRAVLEGIALARHLRCPVRFTFNGQRVHCRPDSIPEEIVQQWTTGTTPRWTTKSIDVSVNTKQAEGVKP